MGNLTWTKVLAILLVAAAGTGVVTQTGLFGALFQLKGMNYTYTGDQVCGEVCEAYINVTTSYWKVCFEHSNRSDIMYKKVASSKTLWVNLNNVSSIISTEPEVTVDWLVPAVGKDNWRPIKDGDCWTAGKVNRIKLVGHKPPWETVEWGFSVGGYVNAT